MFSVSCVLYRIKKKMPKWVHRMSCGLLHDRMHFMRFVVRSKSHFSNGLHFTLPQYALPADALRGIERT